MAEFVTTKHTFVICSVLRNTPKKPHHGDTIGNLCTLARYNKNSIIYWLQLVSDRDGMARVPPVGERCPGIPITDTTPCSVEEFHMEVMAEMAEMRADELELYGSVLLKLKEYEHDKTKRVWKLTEDTEDEVFKIQQQQTARGVKCTRAIDEALEKGDIEEEKIGAAFEAMSTLLKNWPDRSHIQDLPKWWDAIHEAWTKGKWEEVKNKCEEVKDEWKVAQAEHNKRVCDSLIDSGDSVDNVCEQLDAKRKLLNMEQCLEEECGNREELEQALTDLEEIVPQLDASELYKSGILPRNIEAIQRKLAHIKDCIPDNPSGDDQGVQTWPGQRLKSGISKPPHKGVKQPPTKPLSAMQMD